MSVPLLFLHVKKFPSPAERKTHTNWPWHIERARNEEETELMVSRGEGSKTKVEKWICYHNTTYSCDVQLYASESQVLFVQCFRSSTQHRSYSKFVQLVTFCLATSSQCSGDEKSLILYIVMCIKPLWVLYHCFLFRKRHFSLNPMDMCHKQCLEGRRTQFQD